MVRERMVVVLCATRKCRGLILFLWVLIGALAGDSVESLVPPMSLAETGLYADFATKTVASDNLAYSPQYPLWSDGASKQRWIYLPPGATIDARDPNNWVFPVGTKFWKEFSFGRRVETRLLEKVAAGEWSYATYAWNESESDAALVSELGLRNHVEIAPGIGHDLPSVNDCKACHEGKGRDAVLGFSALQLSPDRDPLAPHSEALTPGMINLATLIEQDRLTGLPNEYSHFAPRIHAESPQARAALGYLWANCGGCHNAEDPLASVGMYLRLPLDIESDYDSPELPTVVGHASKFKIPGLDSGESYRIKPGDASHSSLVYRMRTTYPIHRMPPLGTKLVDSVAVNLITYWIETDLRNQPQVQK